MGWPRIADPLCVLRDGSRDLIVRDVVDLQPAGIDVSQDHVAFAGAAAEIANSGELPIQADRSHEVSTGDLIVRDVVDL